ncbi:unnamed protein product [Calicophoron daubneyi]|uniref:Uncharacterized protein n=1 Tax=Calicophoron daubneyi TaxID=300641 RepID=A0AAV2T287_CALDB
MVMDFWHYLSSSTGSGFDIFLISVLLCVLVALFFNVLFTTFWSPPREQEFTERTQHQKDNDLEPTFEERLPQKKVKSAQLSTSTESSSRSPKLISKNTIRSSAAKLKQSEDEGLADVSSSDGSQLPNAKVGRPQSSKSGGTSGNMVRTPTQTPALKRNSTKKERQTGSANKPHADVSSTSSGSPKEALQKADRKRLPEPAKTVAVAEHTKSEALDSSSEDWHDVKSKARRSRRQSARSTGHTPSSSVDQIHETNVDMRNPDPSPKQPCELKESLSVAEKPTPPSSDHMVSSKLESESAQPAQKPAQVEGGEAESSKEETTKNVRATAEAPEDDMAVDQSSTQPSKEAVQKASKSRRKRRSASSKKRTEPVAPDTVEKVTVDTESANDSVNLQEKRIEIVHKSSLEDSEFEVIEMPHSSEPSPSNTESDADVSDLGLEQSPKPVAPSAEDLKEFPYLPGADGLFACAPSTTLRPMEGGRHPYAGTLLKAALNDSQEGQPDDTMLQGSTPKRSTKRTKARKAD